MTTPAPEAGATRSLAGQAVGRIAVDLPGATALFRRLKLDFCCGGQISLEQACADRGVALAPVLSELEDLTRRSAAPVSGVPEETAALVQHILDRYHRVHREQLPELVRMARRVEAVHREHPAVPAGLAELLAEIEREMLDHMGKEEEILFPMMLAGGHPMIAHPVAVMRDEHDAHGVRLARLAALTRDHQPPEEACNTWRALYAGTHRFCDDVMEHIHLENNLLFPRFEPPRG